MPLLDPEPAAKPGATVEAAASIWIPIHLGPAIASLAVWVLVSVVRGRATEKNHPGHALLSRQGSAQSTRPTGPQPTIQRSVPPLRPADTTRDSSGWDLFRLFQYHVAHLLVVGVVGAAMAAIGALVLFFG